MWVKVISADGDWLEGTLESTPYDMPQLATGSVIRLPRAYVINVLFDRDETKLNLPPDCRRDYWERCLVDKSVLDGTYPVHYLYREEPDMASDGDKYPDSGWRIRGATQGISDEELEARGAAYVAIGAVLNEDDTWIHLIDEPVGSAFAKDFESGDFVRVDE
jgi:hypothetical protein